MLEKNVPDYYPAMYQDGYTPTEILAAMRKKLRKNVQEQRWNSSQLSNIHLTANVEVKKCELITPEENDRRRNENHSQNLSWKQ